MAQHGDQTRASKRVLVLTTSYPRQQGDSAGHFVKAEVAALRRQGHDVTVAAAGGPFEDPAIINLGGSELFAHPGALPRLRQRPTRLAALLGATLRARRLSADNYDRIDCHWLIPTAYLWGTPFASQRGTLTAVAHGSDVRLLLRLPSPLRNQILSSLRRAGFALRFVAAELKEALMSAGLDDELTSYVRSAPVFPSPIELDGVPSKEQARAALGLQQGEKWAVIVGRLIKEKRTRVALSAADLIPAMNVAVVGSGPLTPQLQMEFPQCTFLGQLPRSETLLWIAAADLLISASQSEGAPTVIREARALGTPVVSAPAGDTPQWARTDNELWLIRSDYTSVSRGNS